MYTKRALGDINIYAMKDDLTTQELSKREKARQYSKQHYKLNKECYNKQSKLHYRKTASVRKEYSYRYYNENKEEQSKRCKEWYLKNKAKLRSRQKEYYNQNKEKNNQKIKARRLVDPAFKLRGLISRRINKAIKLSGTSKAGRTIELLGCTYKEARDYLEMLFKPGMSWENHTVNGWHIDHIKPCNTFNLTDPEQQKECFHYTNLRPLWSKDNLTRPKDGSDVIHQ
jgi:hypothetical protein